MNSSSKRFARSSRSLGFLVLLISFLCTLSLNIIPLPLWMKTLWPLWTVLILIFWTAYLPEVLNPWLVFIIGLLEDVLQGSFLGEHALALLIAYLITRSMSRQIKSYPLFSQIAKIGIILLAYQFILVAFQGFPILTIHDISFWIFPFLTSLIVWPWILFLLHSIAVKFYIHRL
jgi:rod shape-determining protein MreD